MNASGDVTAIAPGRVGIVATTGARADTASVYVRPGELIVEPNAVNTAVGEEIRFSASARAGTAGSGMAVSWTSSNTAVATVSPDGVVTAVGVGDATLIAKAGPQTGSATVSVRLKDIASLRLAPSTSTIYRNQSTQLTVTAYADAGRPIAFDAGSAKWSVSDAAVASVANDGTVNGKAQGSDVVTARIGPKSATASVNVLDVAVSSVAVALDAGTLEVGQVTQAKATLKDTDGSTLTGRTIAWQSSNPAISTVNSSGTVTAITRGSATISAIAEGKVGGAVLTVATKTVAASRSRRTHPLLSAERRSSQQPSRTEVVPLSSAGPSRGSAPTRPSHPSPTPVSWRRQRRQRDDLRYATA